MKYVLVCDYYIVFLEELLYILDEMGGRFLRFDVVALCVSEAKEMLDGDSN